MNPTLENAIEIINALPMPERETLFDWVEEEKRRESAKKQTKNAKLKVEQRKFRLAMKWLQSHREEFDGQWVALDGETLLAHGTDGKKVHAKAQAKGVKTPLMHRVSVKETEPFGGW